MKIKNIDQQEERKNLLFGKIDVQKATNRLLSYSLMWFGLAISFVLLITFSVLKIPAIQKLYLSLFLIIFSNFVWIIIFSITMIALNLLLYWFIVKFARRNIPLAILILAYLVFVILESIWLPLLLMNFDTNSITLIFLIPTLGISLIGLLGYFRVINFEKIMPLVFIAIGLTFIFSLVSFFVMNNWIQTIYAALSVFISFGVVGFTFYRMHNSVRQMVSGYVGYEDEIKGVLIREGLINGLILIVSFVRLVIELIRILDIIKK